MVYGLTRKHRANAGRHIVNKDWPRACSGNTLLRMVRMKIMMSLNQNRKELLK